MKTLDQTIIITGAAGLVGQNLTLALRDHGYNNIIAIDKNTDNLKTLKKLNPGITIVCANFVTDNNWQQYFTKDAVVVMLHAQITGLEKQVFIDNNILATDRIIEQIKKHQINYTVAISSSVVNSVADDFYTQTKTEQEKHVIKSDINCSILRPTLMFGWFDPKHLGWLSRFMAKTPIFPIPGHGKYMRQPLYAMDFCKVIINAITLKKTGTFDIVGAEKINYIDMIRLIKQVKHLKTIILPIPYLVFKLLLKVYSLFSKKPPFTADQLDALTAGDEFSGCNTQKEFNVTQTPLSVAFKEAFASKKYSNITLKRSNL